MEKYLLVAEGPTDNLVIQEIAKELSENLQRNIQIQLLEPHIDASTGGYAPNGWTEVRNWCKSHSVKNANDVKHLDPLLRAVALRKNWKALVQISRARGLVIQIDSDIAHFINDNGQFNPATSTKKQHCTDALLFWIKENAPSNQLFLAVSAQAIETWLLATHPPQDNVFSDLPAGFNYEEIEDYEQRLIAAGHTPTIKKGNTRRLKKCPHTSYNKHAAKIASELATIRGRCASADELCTYLSRP